MKTTENFSSEEKKIGKDCLNLVELPFTLLSKKPYKGQKTIERNWTGQNGSNPQYNFYKIITSSDKYGLPTFIGEEVFIACMELSHRQRFENRTVYANKLEILNVMNWKHGGHDYKRLIKAFNQLSGVLITTNAFLDNRSKKYSEVGFGLIQNYMFSEDKSFFRWDEIYYDYSLKRGNIKTLDTGLYFSLKSSTAKRLYRYADKKLYNQQIFEIDLHRLAFEKLEMFGTAYRYPSKIIQSLKPAIKELKERNIADIKIKESKTDSGYKVCFTPITQPQVVVEQKLETKTTTKSPPRKKTSKATEIVQFFHSFIDPNVKDYKPTKKEFQQASVLLTEHGEGKTEYIIKFAVEQAKKTGFKMEFFGAVIGYADKALTQFHQEEEYQEQLKLSPPPTPSQDIPKRVLNSWNNALKTLESEMERRIFDTWLDRLILIDYKDDCLIVFDEYAASNISFKDELRERVFPKIRALIGNEIRFVCMDNKPLWMGNQ